MKYLFNYKFENLNQIIGTSRANPKYANVIKRKEMDFIREQIRGTKKITNYPVKAYATWLITNKRGDLDNKVLKNILDAFVKEGILENDSMKYVSEIHYFTRMSKEDGLELILEDNNE